MFDYLKENVLKEKVTLYAGPVAYKSWFTYNNRRFVIDLDQNWIFIIFPFLFYIFPLNCYEVESEEDWEKRQRKEMSIAPFIYISPAILMEFINSLTVNINVMPLFSVILAVLTAFIIRMCLRKKLNGRIIKKIKIRIVPNDFGENMLMFLVYIVFFAFSMGMLSVLYDNPNNLYWFLGSVLICWGFFISGSSMMHGKIKVKFLDDKKE